MDTNDNKSDKDKVDKPKFHIPRDQAVALKYDKSNGAPKIVAKGSGYLADRIIGMAKNEDIPVYSDGELVNNLSKLDLGDSIPPELFEIVAHIYAFVDKVDVILESSDDKHNK